MNPCKRRRFSAPSDRRSSHGGVQRRVQGADLQAVLRFTIAGVASDVLAEKLEAARWAVERWAGFAVDRVPRVLAALAETVPARGARTSGHHRRAAVRDRALAGPGPPAPARLAAEVRERARAA